MPWTVDSSGTKTAVDPMVPVTVTSANPGVFTFSAHTLAVNDAVTFTSTGTLASGIVANQKYFVISGGLTSNNFEVAGTFGGTAIAVGGGATGSMTGVVEHMLLISGTNATYQYSADLINGTIGNATPGTATVICMRIYDAIDATNLRQIWQGSFQGQACQGNPGKESPFVPIPVSAWFTISILTGLNAIPIPWRVLRQ